MEDLESKVDDDVKNFLELQASDTAAAAEDAKKLHEAMKVSDAPSTALLMVVKVCVCAEFVDCVRWLTE